MLADWLAILFIIRIIRADRKGHSNSRVVRMEYLICKMTNTNSNKQYFVMMELKNREKTKEKSPYNKQQKQIQDWMKLNNKTSKTKKGEGNNPDEKR